MATQQQILAALQAVDDETTRIGDYIQTLLGQLGSGGLNDQQEAEVLTRLQAAADRLKGIGASPEQPVPEGDLPPVEPPPANA